MSDEERLQAESYLKSSFWKKDACGWWTSPFGYGLDEAIQMHKQAAEATAIAFNSGDEKLLRFWLRAAKPVPVQPATPPPLPDCAACVVPDQGVAHVEGTRQHPRAEPATPQGSALDSDEYKAFRAWWSAQITFDRNVPRTPPLFAQIAELAWLERAKATAEQRAEIKRLRAQLADSLDEMGELLKRLADREASVRKMREALQGIINIGKRDMSNPKYDGYFESARAALAAPDAPPEKENGNG